MTTLTISKSLTRGEELVIIPRKDYEKLRHSYEVLLREKEADDDIAAGRVSNSYTNSKDLKHALNLLKQ